MSTTNKIHSTPIKTRPSRSWYQLLKAAMFFVAMNTGCLMIVASQFIFLLPLLLLPFQWSRELYDEGIRYTKGAFATLLVLMNQWFAPTKFIVTFETEGQGKLTQDEIDNITVKNAAGEVVGIKLPRKSVLIGNHQVYLDWLYAWCIAYFMGTHKDVFIVLKQSLKWVPFAGWAMQFWDFIFLARSWASDRLNLISHLATLGKQAQIADKPFTLFLWPEGTLVSENTRPVSKKYAEKLGIPDMVHILLPRSTGLHYSLRSLAPRIPSLKLIDLTMVYPGVPPSGYGQSFYTLRSIYFDGIPPPALHVHVRIFDVASEVPIGDVSASKHSVVPSSKPSSDARTAEIDFPEHERVKFDLWLRELWREKDRLIEKYHKTGSFVPRTLQAGSVHVPMKLRKKREVLDAFCFFLVGVVVYGMWGKLRW